MKKRVCAFAVIASCFLLLVPSGAGASNDPLFPQQWGLARVNAEPAWNVSRGGGVTIGIVDSGVKYAHPDLAGKVVGGRDFIGEGDADDENGHGTLVAGVAAARTGNGAGIAGVAPDAKILPARVFDANGSAQSDKVAEAIRWTVSAAGGSRLVLNLSFVGPPGSGGGSGVLFSDPGVRDAMLFAASQGALVVAAAGNDGAGSTEYDAPSGRGIIVVGASDKNDACAGFSNYGSGLDILAPGAEILTTYWNRSNNAMTYANASGTSQAVAFVSGAGALLMSKGMSNVSAVNQMIATARGPVSCRGSSGNRILDVAAAVGASVGGPPPAQAGAPAAPAAGKPRLAAKPKAPAARAAPAPLPPSPPPPPPTIILAKPAPDAPPQTLELPAASLSKPARAPAEPADPLRWSAAALFALTGLAQVVVRLIFRPAA